MDNPTIVAVVILAGVFILMAVAILKEGVAGANRLWNIMGALTGVAFGSIVSFYFTEKSNRHEIQRATEATRTAEMTLTATRSRAEAEIRTQQHTAEEALQAKASAEQRLSQITRDINTAASAIRSKLLTGSEWTTLAQTLEQTAARASAISASQTQGSSPETSSRKKYE